MAYIKIASNLIKSSSYNDLQKIATLTDPIKLKTALLAKTFFEEKAEPKLQENERVLIHTLYDRATLALKNWSSTQKLFSAFANWILGQGFLNTPQQIIRSINHNQVEKYAQDLILYETELQKENPMDYLFTLSLKVSQIIRELKKTKKLDMSEKSKYLLNETLSSSESFLNKIMKNQVEKCAQDLASFKIENSKSTTFKPLKILEHKAAKLIQELISIERPEMTADTKSLLNKTITEAETFLKNTTLDVARLAVTEAQESLLNKYRTNLQTLENSLSGSNPLDISKELQTMLSTVLAEAKELFKGPNQDNSLPVQAKRPPLISSTLSDLEAKIKKTENHIEHLKSQSLNTKSGAAGRQKKTNLQEQIGIHQIRFEKLNQDKDKAQTRELPKETTNQIKQLIGNLETLQSLKVSENTKIIQTLKTAKTLLKKLESEDASQIIKSANAKLKLLKNSYPADLSNTKEVATFKKEVIVQINNLESINDLEITKETDNLLVKSLDEAKKLYRRLTDDITHEKPAQGSNDTVEL